MAVAPGLSRLDAPGRIAGADLARGLAVIGMLAAHLLVTDDAVDPTDASTWDGVVNGNSSILFATLAGVSIGLLTGGRRPVAAPRRGILQGRLLVRAAALWIVGLALMLLGVPVYVILPAYAVMFALAVPLVGLTARPLWILAGALAAVMPFVHAFAASWPGWQTPLGGDVSLLIGWHYPFEVWIAFVVAGLALARSGLDRTPVLAAALAGGALVSGIAFALDVATGARASGAASGDDDGVRVWTAEPHSSGLLEVWGSGGLAVAIIAACVLLCRGDGGGGIVGRILLPLRAAGSMPLTAYASQIVVWAIAAAALGVPGDLAGFREAQPFWPMTLGILAGCTLWALVLGRGPLERGIEGLARVVVRPR